MERILTTEQMRQADRFTIDELGVLEETLVFRAGKAVADEIVKRFHGGRVLVCIGNGNNGEDGKVIARLLSEKHGFSVTTVNVKNGIFKVFDYKYDLIVDCIFGTGLNRNVEGKYKTAIEKINASGAYVVACDIPSGLNGDNGSVMGVAVKARLTIAIQEFKTGHFLGEGLDYCGETIAKDIGISIWGEDFVCRINDVTCKTLFPKRARTVNKGSFGRTILIGGSKTYSGSAILALNALSALKMGNGYSTLIVPECLFSSCMGLYPECVLNAIPEKDGKIDYCPDILSRYLNADGIAIGMGVGVSLEVYLTIKFLLENYSGRLLIDADGLNCLATYGLDVLLNKKCQVVLTPHIGEFSRLSGFSKQEILMNSLQLSKDFAKKYKVVLLLKSSVSVITDGDRIFLNTTGNSGMAKAGSGDVLSGLSLGLLTRDEDLLLCTAVGSYLFGKCGEKAVKHANEYTVTASDFISVLPEVINEL